VDFATSYQAWHVMDMFARDLMQYPASTQAQENTSERTSYGTTYVLDSSKSLDGERGELTIVAKSGARCRVRLVGSGTRHGDVRLL
jgi:hypothetical protein